MSNLFSFNDGLAQLRALGEPTRLRIALLLFQGELSVSDLVDILGQSQPRLSRHLKLMQEAGLILRSPEGAYAYYRLHKNNIIHTILESYATQDPILAADKTRLKRVREERENKANLYFAQNAADWDRLRALHISEEIVEKAILKALESKPLTRLLDLGTGTGRMLSLLSPYFKEGVGIDSSSAMLNVARSQLAKEGIMHVSLKQGDIYALNQLPASYNAVIIHQVLHFLEDAEKAIAEAATTLASQGVMLIIDFAPHRLEFLRESQNHLRLGFARETIEDMLTRQGLTPLSFTHLTGETQDQLSVCLWLAQKD